MNGVRYIVEHMSSNFLHLKVAVGSHAVAASHYKGCHADQEMKTFLCQGSKERSSLSECGLG